MKLILIALCFLSISANADCKGRLINYKIHKNVCRIINRSESPIILWFDYEGHLDEDIETRFNSHIMSRLRPSCDFMNIFSLLTDPNLSGDADDAFYYKILYPKQHFCFVFREVPDNILVKNIIKEHLCITGIGNVRDFEMSTYFAPERLEMFGYRGNSAEIDFSEVTMQKQESQCTPVKLERFTKEILSLYLSQTDTGNDNVLAIECSEDSTHYYALIYADTIINSRNVFDETYQNYKVIVSGVSIPYMFKGCYPASPEINEVNHDPLVWQICIYKNGKLCPMHTYKATPEDNIDDIILLAQKHLKGITIEKSDLDYIYSNIEVEHPAEFPLGDNGLRNLIKASIRIHGVNLQPSVPVVIELLIDKNGDATISRFLKSSADEDIDKEALMVAEIVCGYQFIPASHRGENVSVNFALFFIRNDFAEQSGEKHE